MSSARSVLSRVLVLGLALMAAGCLRKSGDEIATGSLGPSIQRSEQDWRKEVEALGKRYESDSSNKGVALSYSRALRAVGQTNQAVAVLEQLAIKMPKDNQVLAAYGKVLTEVGRVREAGEILARAHSPDRPDWRILSAQGIASDQMGDHAAAQRFYEAALRIAPDEPSVMSNLGFSYALTKRLAEAEVTLRRAAASPRADARVRQNLVLVLGLVGKFEEAERVAQQDLSPVEAAQNIAYLRGVVTQPNAWKALGGVGAAPAAKPKAGRG